MRYRDIEKRLAELERQAQATPVHAAAVDDTPATEEELWTWAAEELHKYVADRGVNLGTLSPEGKSRFWKWRCERAAITYGYRLDDYALAIVTDLDGFIVQHGKDTMRVHPQFGPLFDVYTQARVFLAFDGVYPMEQLELQEGF